MRNTLLGLLLIVSFSFAGFETIFESGDWLAGYLTNQSSSEVARIAYLSNNHLLLFEDVNTYKNAVTLTWDYTFSGDQSVDFRVDNNESISIFCSATNLDTKLFFFLDDEFVSQMLDGDELILSGVTFANGSPRTLHISLTGMTACLNAVTR